MSSRWYKEYENYVNFSEGLSRATGDYNGRRLGRRCDHDLTRKTSWSDSYRERMDFT